MPNLSTIVLLLSAPLILFCFRLLLMLKAFFVRLKVVFETLIFTTTLRSGVFRQNPMPFTVLLASEIFRVLGHLEKVL